MRQAGLLELKIELQKPIRCKWSSLTTSCIKILGIHFSYNKVLAVKENFYSLNLDCRALLNIWKQRWLSLAGKIQVCKSLVTSKPVYVATMIPVPQKCRDTLESLHKEFIWNGKKAKIKNSSLIEEYRDGGLKDVDIDGKILSLKILWVRQLKDSNFHPWKVLANHLLSPVGGEAIFHTNLCLSKRFRQRTNDLPLFYKELVLTWEKYSVSKSLTVGQIATQSLWNNQFIHTKSESLYDELLVSKGIMTVSNLFENEGELKNYETVSQEFSLNPIHFLKWYGVLKSISSCWKKTLKGYMVHSLSSGKGKMFLCAACHAFTPHVNAWKNLIGIVFQIQARE